jgi:hypothetical protein
LEEWDEKTEKWKSFLRTTPEELKRAIKKYLHCPHGYYSCEEHEEIEK